MLDLLKRNVEVGLLHQIKLQTLLDKKKKIYRNVKSAKRLYRKDISSITLSAL